MKMSSVSPTRKYILAWLVLPFIAVFNAVLRELTYKDTFGEHAAHQVSSVLLCIMIMFYVVALNNKIELKSASEALKAGTMWLLFTIVFETALGLATGAPLSRLLENYNILRGHLWILVLLTTFLSPVLLRGHKVLHVH